MRLRNRAHVRNGTISVVSSGTPGDQAGIHAPVLIGALYGDSPSTAITQGSLWVHRLAQRLPKRRATSTA